MQKHTKIYLDFFAYGMHTDVFIPCEFCGNRSVDVHHLEGRGEGKNVIENLIGLCRFHHTWAENDPEFNDKMKVVHIKFIQKNG